MCSSELSEFISYNAESDEDHSLSLSTTIATSPESSEVLTSESEETPFTSLHNTFHQTHYQ